MLLLSSSSNRERTKAEGEMTGQYFRTLPNGVEDTRAKHSSWVGLAFLMGPSLPIHRFCGKDNIMFILLYSIKN